MDEKEIVARNLTKYRKQAGLSQLELAKKLNYSNKNISKWENGETTPSVFVLNEIAKLYGVKVDAFLSWSDEPPQDEIKKTKPFGKNLFRISMLLLANAILYAVGTVLIYSLHYVNLNGFNKYLIYLYLAPLTFLSIIIYVRVLYKFVDIISLSGLGWSVILGIYLTCFNLPHMAFIFIIGVAYEVIAIFMALLINIKLFNKRPAWLKNIFKKKPKQKENADAN